MNELYTFNKDDAFRFAQGTGIRYKQSGNELEFQYCPYCMGGKSHDQRTFSISLVNGAWNCKRGSCGKTGNMITLSKEFDWFSLGDGIDDYYQKRERFKAFAKRPIEVKDAAVKYLKKRCIPEEITRKYEITMKNGTDDILVFPFKDENDKMWFVKYRNIKYEKGVTNGSKEWCESNRKPILFGMNHCNFKNSILIMTEGQIDSLSVAAAGYENAVSVPTGKNGFTWVPYCWNFLGRFEELIVFGDLEDGQISLLDYMKTTFHGTVKHVRPEDYRGCKDANDILRRYGKDAIRKCIDNAMPIDVPGLKRLSEIQRVNLKDLDRMTTGIREIDEKCKFYFGELIILTGAAGDGKSTMASQWATMALNQGYPTMIYSGEMQSWLVKNWIDFQLAGPMNVNSNNDIIEETYNMMKSWDMYDKLYVYDLDDADVGQDKLIDKMLNGIRQYGIRFIVIDNLMTAMDYDGVVELNNAQTTFTKKLATIAQNRNAIIVLVVHPRKSTLRTFSNDDIGGSSNIVNRAHKTIRYARPDSEFTDKDGRQWTTEELHDCPIRMLTVLKDRMTGNTMSKGIPLYFDPVTKRISDMKAGYGFDWRLGWEPEFLNVPDGVDEEVPF